MTESDIQVIRDSLAYDPVTGQFARRTDTGLMHITVARWIVLGGKKHSAAKIAWLLGTGKAPASAVHHLNSNRSDYRLINLHVGERHKAQVRVGPVVKHLGYYPTREARNEAIAQFRTLHAAGLITL